MTRIQVLLVFPGDFELVAPLGGRGTGSGGWAALAPVAGPAEPQRGGAADPTCLSLNGAWHIRTASAMGGRLFCWRGSALTLLYVGI